MRKKIAVLLFGLCVIYALSVFPSNGAQFCTIVKNMGYNCLDEPIEVCEINIPEEFNAVYLRYNELQKSGGYDLSLYRGKRCVRYTYLIPDKNARANILVYRGKIIGGDICSITLDGIMLPLQKSYEKG